MIKRGFIGILLGLSAVIGIIAAIPHSLVPIELETAGLMPENAGALREIVMHYTRGAWPIVGRTYSDFLSALGPEVIAHIVCPGERDYKEFLEKISGIKVQLNPVIVDHAITPWAKDRWLALLPGAADSPLVLYRPWREDLADGWKERAGDQRVADDLADVRPHTAAVRAPFFFDAGDFAASGGAVFAVPAVLTKNLHRTVHSEGELVKKLESVFKRRVVLLKEAPPHHAGMFMMPVAETDVLVGDPSLVKRELSPRLRDALNRELPGGPDFSAATQELYDAAAREIEGRGFRVIRIPTVNAPKSKIYITYLNAVIEKSGAERIVYMPAYDDLGELNTAAARVWNSAGFKVKEVSVSDAYRHGGTLHCLVNPLRRATS